MSTKPQRRQPETQERKYFLEFETDFVNSHRVCLAEIAFKKKKV